MSDKSRARADYHDNPPTRDTPSVSSTFVAYALIIGTVFGLSAIGSCLNRKAERVKSQGYLEFTTNSVEYLEITGRTNSVYEGTNSR
jgi:hypothetical protein